AGGGRQRGRRRVAGPATAAAGPRRPHRTHRPGGPGGGRRVRAGGGVAGPRPARGPERLRAGAAAARPAGAGGRPAGGPDGPRPGGGPSPQLRGRVRRPPDQAGGPRRPGRAVRAGPQEAVAAGTARPSSRLPDAQAQRRRAHGPAAVADDAGPEGVPLGWVLARWARPQADFEAGPRDREAAHRAEWADIFPSPQAGVILRRVAYVGHAASILAP